MKKTKNQKPYETDSDDLRPEYDFDFSRSRPNRFANRLKQKRMPDDFVETNEQQSMPSTKIEKVLKSLRE